MLSVILRVKECYRFERDHSLLPLNNENGSRIASWTANAKADVMIAEI